MFHLEGFRGYWRGLALKAFGVFLHQLNIISTFLAMSLGLSELNKMSRLSKALVTLLVLALVGYSYCWGVVYGESSVEPEVIVRTEHINHYIEKPVVRVVETFVEKKVVEEVPIIKTVTDYIDRPVKKYIPVREPISVEEAQSWVDENNLPKVLVADSNGVIYFNDYKGDSRYDCDDAATDFEDLALAAGLKITQIPVVNGRIWGVKVTDIMGNHVGNWTKINGIYYYIESSPSENSFKLVKIMSAD